MTRLGSPLLVNEVTGEERVQGANRFGFLDWPGLVEYADIDIWAGPPVTEEQAMGLPGIGRGVGLVCGVISGLTPYRVRNAESVSAPTQVMDPDELLKNPDPYWHKGHTAWTSALVRDMMLYGNGFARHEDLDRFAFPHRLPLLSAKRMSWEPSENDASRKVYVRRGDDGTRTEYEPDDLFHAPMNPRPEKRMGVGILAQYQEQLRTMVAIEHAQWVVMSKGRPVGVLSIDSDMIPDELREAKEAFLEGVRRDGIAALVKAGFSPVSWNATDLSLIEARELNMRYASQITGMSPYLLGVPSESRVYANIESEWSNAIETSFQQYLKAIQDPYSACYPRGTVVRYNVDELRRPESKTRWEIYKIAVELGAMSIPEVRQAEHMGPRIDAPDGGQEGETE